ncbi:MAG TPA: hypothetical protein VI796_07505, partial [Candidatus Thermoplasmatota archaeon]|nr:hypothetical protein [Candidatus Thermoplasmatota archaeon]
GGRDARRFEEWQIAGLEVRSPSLAKQQAVEAAARAAGTLSRLSPADRSLLALALELGAVLLTDDYTMLDVAKRLGVATRTVSTEGIRGTLDFKPRCAGCGRWFDAEPKEATCPVCGSPVRPKPRSQVDIDPASKAGRVGPP